jgi:HSP20 family protein
MEVRYENGWAGRNWLFEQMNGMLKDFHETPRRLLPAADVVEDQDAYRFYFEMPGLKGESLDVRVENDALVVTAERKRSEIAETAKVHVAERSYGTIRRAFELPEDADRDKIHANYKDGVLEVTVEKLPERKPLKIQVN